MKTLVTLATPLFAAVALPIHAQEKSPIISPVLSDGGPKEVEAAKVQGAATAAQDIAAKKLRILYFGEPMSKKSPMVDEATGYPLLVVAGCIVSEVFVAEVTAYNQAMRDWHAKNHGGAK